MPGLDPLADKYRAFNWDVQEIDGHNFEEIFSALKAAQKAQGPAVIISHTVRGKGVSFMEGSTHWHAGVITKEQYDKAMGELA
jgi:transketolase